MQNKPNFRKAKMNVNNYYIKDYQNFISLAGYKNKPKTNPILSGLRCLRRSCRTDQTQSNPIKSNLQNAQMNINSPITKDYRKNDDFVVRINKPNSKPISVKHKMSANAFSQKDYDNETAFEPQKNKPKQTQFKPNLVRRRRIPKG